MGFLDWLMPNNERNKNSRLSSSNYVPQQDFSAEIARIDECAEFLFNRRDSFNTYKIGDLSISYFGAPTTPDKYKIYQSHEVRIYADTDTYTEQVLRFDSNLRNSYTKDIGFSYIISILEEEKNKIQRQIQTQSDLNDRLLAWFSKVESRDFVERAAQYASTNPKQFLFKYLGEIYSGFRTIAKNTPLDPTFMYQSGLTFECIIDSVVDDEGGFNPTYSTNARVRFRGNILYEPEMSNKKFIEYLESFNIDWYRKYQIILLQSLSRQSDENSFERFKKINKYYQSGYTDSRIHISYEMGYKSRSAMYQSVLYVVINDMTRNGECVYYYDALKDRIEIKKYGPWVKYLANQIRNIESAREQSEQDQKAAEYRRRTQNYRPYD